MPCELCILLLKVVEKALFQALCEFCKFFHLIFSGGPSPSLGLFLQMNKLIISQLNTLWVLSAHLWSSLCSSHFSTTVICEIQLPWLQCTSSSILPSRKFPRPYRASSPQSMTLKLFLGRCGNYRVCLSFLSDHCLSPFIVLRNTVKYVFSFIGQENKSSPVTPPWLKKGLSSSWKCFLFSTVISQCSPENQTNEVCVYRDRDRDCDTILRNWLMSHEIVEADRFQNVYARLTGWDAGKSWVLRLVNIWRYWENEIPGEGMEATSLSTTLPYASLLSEEM